MSFTNRVLQAPHQKILRVLSLTLAIVVLAGMIVMLVPGLRLAWHGIPHKVFDLDTEGNVPTLFSAGLILGGAFVAYAIAITEENTNRTLRLFWMVCAAMLVFMCIDELTGIHNQAKYWVPKEVSEIGIFKFRWVVTGIGIVILASLILLPFLRHLPKSTRNFLMLAATVYLTGALIMEMVGALAFERFGSKSMQYLLCIVGEESLEMLGMLLAIAAMFDYTNMRNRN